MKEQLDLVEFLTVIATVMIVIAWSTSNMPNR